MSHILTVSDVAIIARTAKSTKQRTKLEAWTLLKRVDTRLKQAGAGELALAEDVRLSLPQVVKLLWQCRRIALAQWRAAKAAQAAAAREAQEADILADYREALAAEHAAELAEVLA